jgi:hypothetical protein
VLDVRGWADFRTAVRTVLDSAHRPDEPPAPMAAAYLVQADKQSPSTAVRANLAVGPPSIEQIYYGLSLGKEKAEQPPLAVMAVSRLVDAPRRMLTWL